MQPSPRANRNLKEVPAVCQLRSINIRMSASRVARPPRAGFDKARYIGIIPHPMTASVRVQAPAKINLHLRVYGRRFDGYHGIRSLFQAVSLSDLIVIRSLKEIDRIEIEGVFDCAPENTTVHKAVEVFRGTTGIRTGVAISVRKSIPAGAGLGGGSSDAASVLSGLNSIFDAGLGTGDLAFAGSLIGSDVPFFARGAAAIVEGRGDEVQAITPREAFALVLAYPGFPVATAGAYALLDRDRPDDSSEPDPSPEEIETAYRGRFADWKFHNSFEPFVSTANPAIGALAKRLERSGSAFSGMTGSGSCVFGVYEDSDRAQRARASLEADGVLAFAALSLARVSTLD
jgi:4-diphosphocytidyl-2-C-methyl-D-erythritol kinase